MRIFLGIAGWLKVYKIIIAKKRVTDRTLTTYKGSNFKKKRRIPPRLSVEMLPVPFFTQLSNDTP